MIRLILLSVLFLLSLLTVFRAPTNFLWYISILVTEFSWVFFCVVVMLLLWSFQAAKYNFISSIIGVVSLVLFAVPVIGAYRLSSKLSNAKIGRFAGKSDDPSPFSFGRMITGINAKEIPYKTFTYDTINGLTLDFYQAATGGNRPCVVVVHGGSWAGGDSRQLPELNSKLSKAGYHVASINYRLAPKYKFPSPLEDLKAALTYLRTQSNLLIDSSNFVLLGRSAGGQIVLSAAYMLKNPTVKGVICFYGPTDMIWGYANPTNPLVLNSRKVMENYLGGTYKQVPQQYFNSSATETAKPGAVPALLIYGKNDPLVSHLHGIKLGKKLDSLGVKHHDLYLSWATHAFDWTLNGPSGQLSTWSVMRFLEDVTGNSNKGNL